ncbi:MAG: L,D-transpeptidase family protein [Enterobacteriaceae bacterium]
MKKIGLLLLALFLTTTASHASSNKGDLQNGFLQNNNKAPQNSKITLAKPYARGLPVYIQLFKEEGVLELYVKLNNQFRLLENYQICKFSGGLGPKQVQGDLKSPEGFYQATLRDLNPNSRFHKSINLGYPNEYDRAHGYTGDYLLIHGKCNSTGCYAMTNDYIEEIYDFVQAALRNGQSSVAINIYPFRMSEQNMQRHRNSRYIAFWKQLKPGYDYFTKHSLPPTVSVSNRQYVVQRPLSTQPPTSEYAFSKAE